MRVVNANSESESFPWPVVIVVECEQITADKTDYIASRPCGTDLCCASETALTDILQVKLIHLFLYNSCLCGFI